MNILVMQEFLDGLIAENNELRAENAELKQHIVHLDAALYKRMHPEGTDELHTD